MVGDGAGQLFTVWTSALSARPDDGGRAPEAAAAVASQVKEMAAVQVVIMAKQAAAVEKAAGEAAKASSGRSTAGRPGQRGGNVKRKRR